MKLLLRFIVLIALSFTTALGYCGDDIQVNQDTDVVSVDSEFDYTVSSTGYEYISPILVFDPGIGFHSVTSTLNETNNTSADRNDNWTRSSVGSSDFRSSLYLSGFKNQSVTHSSWRNKVFHCVKG